MSLETRQSTGSFSWSRWAGPLLSLLVGVTLAPAAEAERPNVVLICVDDLKPTIGCFGDAFAKTPNIDRLAGYGVVFTKAYVQQAVCAPSRMSLLTGMRPDQLGIYDLETSFRGESPEMVTLPQAFLRAGWHAEAVGKVYHHDDPASWSIPHVQPDDSTPMDHPGGPDMPADAVAAKRPDGWIDRGAPWAWPDCDDSVTRDARTAAHAVQRLSALAESTQPFFLAVGFSKPHLPFRAPKRYWDMYDPAHLPVHPADESIPAGSPAWAGNAVFGELRQYSDIQSTGPLTSAQARVMVHGYYASVSFVDAQIGKVIDELEKLDLLRNTIVILWGDHGWHLGDHGWWSKHTNYEQATRNPIIICSPGMTQGARTASLAATIDLYPTLCSLAGIQAPANLPGRDLSPLLKNPDASVQSAVLSVYPRKPNGIASMGRALRTTRWRYIEWRKFDDARTLIAEELYDMEEDPGETRSLAADPQYRTLMDSFQTQLKQLSPAKPQIKTPSKPDVK